MYRFTINKEFEQGFICYGRLRLTAVWDLSEIGKLEKSKNHHILYTGWQLSVAQCGCLRWGWQAKEAAGRNRGDQQKGTKGGGEGTGELGQRE